MARLPDIPVEAWIRDQQEQFSRKIGGLFPAFEFEQAASDQETTIPTDWPMPGGQDQWQEAERQRIEDESRRAQQEQEAEQERQRAEQERQLADYYRKLQAQSEAAGEQATQAAGAAGIPTPDEVFSDLQGTAAGTIATDNTSTTGALDNLQDLNPSPTGGKLGRIAPDLAPTDAVMGDYLEPSPKDRQYREGMDNTSTMMLPKSPAEQFGAYADGLFTQHFGAEDTAAEPDNSSSAIWPDLGAAASSAYEGTKDLGTRAYEGIKDAGNAVSGPISDLYSTATSPEAEQRVSRALTSAGLPDAPALAHLPERAVEQFGIGHISGQLERQRELEDEQATSAGRPQDITGRDDPNWRAANPEKAAELDDLRTTNTLTVGGTVGTGGSGSLPNEAIDAIKALRTAGYADDVILAAERNLAERSPLTLEAIQKLTRGETAAVQSAAPRVGVSEEPPTPPTSTTSATGPEGVRGIPIEAAAENRLPGRDFVPGDLGSERVPTPRTPTEPGNRVTGIGPVEESEAARLQSLREQYDTGRRPYRETELQADVEARRAQPGAVEQIVEEANQLDPRDPAQRQRILADTASSPEPHVRYAAAEDRMRQIAADVQAYEKEHGAVPADMLHEAHLAALDLADANTGVELAQRAGRGAMTHASAASRALNAVRRTVKGSVALHEAERTESVVTDVQRTAEAVRKAREAGGLDEDTDRILTELETRLRNPRNRKAITGTTGEEAISDVPTLRRNSGKGGGTPAERAATSSEGPREESLAERLGRAKRELGRLSDNPGGRDLTAIDAKQAEIDAILAEVRANAQERAQQILARKPNRPVNAEEAERIVNDAIGRRAIGRINRQAVEDASGRTAAREQEGLTKALEQAIQKKINDETSLQTSIEHGVNRRIDAALAREKRATVRDEVRHMASDARIMHRAIRKAPNDAGLIDVLDTHLRAMAEHSNAGENVARDLRASFEADLGEDAFRQLSNVERRNADALRARELAATRSIHDRLMSDTLAQIQTVKSARNSPGAADRLETLYEYLTRLGDRGSAKASKLRQSTLERGLYQAGIAQKGDDLTGFRQLISQVDPKDPNTLKPLLNIMGKPKLWDYVKEISYINMLSSPSTNETNFSSNLFMATGRLLLHNPISWIASGGQNTGGIAALQAAGGSLGEAARLAGTVMKTGYNPRRVDNAIANSSFNRIQREYLSDGRMGKLGELMHAISTRPLEAMDAFFGHIMYASGTAQMAQQKADSLIRQGMKGDRIRVAQSILKDIWDHPDVIEKAGKISDYSLFRSASVSPGKATNEAGMLRQSIQKFVAKGLGETGADLLLDFLLPFWNIPMNFLAQGLDRTVGPLITAPKAVAARLRGDREQAGELGARAVIGAATMGTAVTLAYADLLTGDGPTDPTQRANWLNDHKINSFRFSPNGAWISWEGTPWAVPFAAVANAKEGYSEAKMAARKAGTESDAFSTGAAVAAGTGRGLLQGMASQSLLQQVAQNVSTLTGQDAGLGTVSNIAASSAARYAPTPLFGIPTGLLNFLSTITDTVERDVGRPRNISELGPNIQARLDVRVPGLRERTPERLTEFGQPVSNERSLAVSGPAALIPNYRGRAPLENDPITRQLSSVGMGVPAAPNAVTMGKGSVDLTINEQREFARVYGQEFRAILEANGGGRESLTQRELEFMRNNARDAARRSVLNNISDAELDRRWQAKPVLEATP